MRILHLIYDHTDNPWIGGGGAVRVFEINRRLAARGHKITIVSGRYPGARDYDEGGLFFRFVGYAKNNYILSTFSYAREAARFLKNHNNEFDLVIEDFAPWNPVFSIFLTKTPVILHINHREGLNILKRWFLFGIPFFFIEKFYPGLFTNITALSEETRRKINRPEAFIVPAGIKSDFYSDNFLLSDAEVVDNGYLFYVGRLHIKNKGLDTLLSTMTRQDIKLVIAGKGGDEVKLKAIAGSLRLHNIEFTGFVSEERKISLMKACSIFVMPSRFEGQGIVALEAAACGKPVIVSDIPELRYAVDGGFGLSFKTGNADDLSNKIRFLLENESLRNEMGQKGREYARGFTWDRIADQYESFLLKVIGNS